MSKYAISAALAAVVMAVLFVWMRALVQPQPSLEAENRQEPPPTSFEIPSQQVASVRPPECRELIKRYRPELDGLRQCSDHQDCFHVSSGWLPMLAVNRQERARAERRVEELAQACGPRASHDAFYSDYGIEVLCVEKSCSVIEITSEEFRRRLQAETIREIQPTKMEAQE